MSNSLVPRGACSYQISLLSFKLPIFFLSPSSSCCTGEACSTSSVKARCLAIFSSYCCCTFLSFSITSLVHFNSSLSSCVSDTRALISFSRFSFSWVVWAALSSARQMPFAAPQMCCSMEHRRSFSVSGTEPMVCGVSDKRKF